MRNLTDRAIGSIAVLCALVLHVSQAQAQEEKPNYTLITNVKIFDGVHDRLTPGNVLIENNLIKQVGDKLEAPHGAKTINGGGRTLMPGLIDAHVHLQLNKNFTEIKINSTSEGLALRSLIAARRTLMDGFTTVRDVGGNVFDLKRVIDRGLTPGPRIYPSGAFISQTSGHGDFGDLNRPNPQLSGHRFDSWERMGIAMIVDGRPNVLAAVRQNLRQGATQIKIMGGGGGSSPYDPIDTTGFTADEMRAAVEAAEDWGTYVTAHIFTDNAVRRFVAAGGKCLEHGFFMSEDTIKLCAEKGVWVVPQTWGMSPELFNNPILLKSKHAGIQAMHQKHADFPKWLVKHDVKVAFASDWLGEFDDGDRSRRYELSWRAEYFGSNFEVLKQATSAAGELMSMSGKRNPYPGKLGVIEEGALADVLVVDGNPLVDLGVLGANPKWFGQPEPMPIETIRLIMKDGKMYKNTLK